MKLDTHVHTFYSGDSTIRPLHLFMRECYNRPEGVYRVAKSRGMDLVVITDHDEINGALALANRPDAIFGSEVTGVFVERGRSGSPAVTLTRIEGSVERGQKCLAQPRAKTS